MLDRQNLFAFSTRYYQIATLCHSDSSIFITFQLLSDFSIEARFLSTDLKSFEREKSPLLVAALSPHNFEWNLNFF